jgi:hypothetical protein
MPNCEYCGINKATHFCTNCGHWVCNSPACLYKAAAKGAVNIGRAVASDATLAFNRLMKTFR